MQTFDSGWEDYERRFADSADVDSYDAMYAGQSVDSMVWELEQQLLARAFSMVEFVVQAEDRRALDFACGTGRLTGLLIRRGWDTTGLDVSGEMLRVARSRYPDAHLTEGDITDSRTRSALAEQGQYQLVTAFRFFLNTPRSTRLPVLRALSDVVAEDGFVILNNHGSSPSLRQLGIRVRGSHSKRSDAVRPTSIRQRDFEELISSANLQIVDRFGLGLFVRTIYENRVLGGLANRLERRLSAGGHRREALARSVGSNQVYVCRPIPSS